MTDSRNTLHDAIDRLSESSLDILLPAIAQIATEKTPSKLLFCCGVLTH